MQSKIERQVMASVGVVYLGRTLVGKVALKVYALGAAVVALWQFTWVHKVLSNWASVGPAGTWHYVSYAVLHTHLPVQLALLVAAAAAVALAVDAARALSRPPMRLA